MNAKTFCIIPWSHACINPDGGLVPCSRISTDFPTKNIDTVEDFSKDWWNNESMQQLRNDQAQGIKTKYCDLCWKDEAAGKPSLRQEYNKRLAKHTNLRMITKSSTYIADDLPIALDLNLSNICNYKCLMCGPMFSSEVQTERNQNQVKFKSLDFLLPPVNYNSNWPNEEKFQSFFYTVMPTLRKLELKGGEPLLIKNVLNTIESIQDKKNCILSITTNGSVELDDDFVEQLEQFERIWMFVSVDGVGEHGEYVRYGSSWPTVDKTISRLSKLKNCNFSLATVLQFYSSLTFPSVVDYAIEHNLDIQIQNCTRPNFLNINSMLPTNFAIFSDYINQKTQQHPEAQYLKVVQGFLKSYVFEPELHEQCRQFTSVMDDIRHNRLDAVQELFHNA
jgi:radical SAM protein with 4Fe4S-binding SPASM domain